MTLPSSFAAETKGPSAGGVETMSPAKAVDTPQERAARRAVFPFLHAPQEDDELGQLGGYRVLGVLGQGGMGVVFRAEDPGLQRLVALKVMLPEAAAHPTGKARFLREARAIAALTHDHVIAVHQVGEDNGVPFLVMPLLQGEALEERLERDRQLSVGETLRIGREIAEALAAAHAKGLIHRDIKPSNVWLEAPTGRVKVLDFGLARAGDDEGDKKLTRPGALLGTPSYLAPEQAEGRSEARSDLFSLGCVLYELATGRRAFDGGSLMAILACVAAVTPPAPHQLNAAVPAALSELVMALLAKRPEGRPPSAEAVAQRLRALAEMPGEKKADGAAGGPAALEAVDKPVFVEPIAEKEAHLPKGLVDTHQPAPGRETKPQRRAPTQANAAVERLDVVEPLPAPAPTGQRGPYQAVEVPDAVEEVPLVGARAAKETQEVIRDEVQRTHAAGGRASRPRRERPRTVLADRGPTPPKPPHAPARPILPLVLVLSGTAALVVLLCVVSPVLFKHLSGKRKDTGKEDTQETDVRFIPGRRAGGSRSVQDNFDKVKDGMSADEVKKVMGSDGKKAEMPVGGLYSLTWEEGNKMYIISFKDDKVADKKADNK